MAIRKTQQEKARLAAEARAVELRKQAAQLNTHARALSREAGAGLAETMNDLAERAAELAERLRGSDAYGQALERGGELATTARERSLMAAGAARARLADSGLDERAEEVLGNLRDSDTYLQARDRTTAATRGALTALGGWLGSGAVGKSLGVQPKRRRWPVWVLAVFGVGAGYAVGVLTAPKPGKDVRDDWAAASQSAVDQATKAAERTQQDTSDVSAPASQKPLADKIRTVLGEDPRTSGLPKLNVNVVEGTVFVRGSVAEDVDTEAIRNVIADVEGVEDVDLQLSRS